MIACLLQTLSKHEYLAIWLTACGTIGAVIISLVLALRNRSQLQQLLRTLAIPAQIDLHERAAKRLEKNGSLFPNDRDASGFYVIPSDKRALRKHRDVLEKLQKQYNQELKSITDKNAPLIPEQQESLKKKVRNIHLLLPHIETLIQCHEQLEKITGIETVDPDKIEKAPEAGTS